MDTTRETSGGSGRADQPTPTGVDRAGRMNQPTPTEVDRPGRVNQAPPTLTDYLPRARAALWPQLPTLAAGGVLVCLACVVPILVTPGITPVSLVLAAFTVGPAWAALIATTDDIVLHDREPGVRTLLRMLRRHALSGISTALVPAVPAASALLALAMYRSVPDQWWLLLPAGLACTTATLAALASPAAFPLRVTGGLRGRRLWLAAVTLTARAPAVSVGVAALVFLGILAGTWFTASLLLLLPGPVSLLTSAGIWTVAHRHAEGTPPGPQPRPG